MDKLISVIVPIYNIENYLNRCIKSIVNQSYKNIEIILVDDGSTDRSIDLCLKWEKSDKRIKIIRKRNGGLSDARNAGLSIARGDYIVFIDGDDEINLFMIEKLFYAAYNSNSTVSMCRMEKIEKHTRYATREFISSSNTEVLSGIEALRLLLLDKVDCSTNLKLYHKDVFANVRFPIGITNEDFAVLYKIFYSVQKVTYISDILYYYYYRENSITSSAFSNRQFDKLDNCLEMIKFVKLKVPEVSLEAKDYLLRQSIYLLKTLCLNGLEDKYSARYWQIRKIIINNSFYILKSKWLSKKEKGMYFYLAWFPHIYKKMHN